MTTIEQETGPMKKLTDAEPLAGIVTLKFLRNLMDLNPALRPSVERPGFDEFELWQSIWTSVYTTPFGSFPEERGSDASLMTPRREAPAKTGSAVGEALLWTLDSCFREDFTPEARHAWETLYRFVNETAWDEHDIAGRNDASDPETVAV
jgi:hypothetical protein